MYVFENIFRRFLFTKIKNKDYYVHSLKDTRAFEVDNGLIKSIKKANRIFHIMWCVFIAVGSGFMSVFYKQNAGLTQALYFAVYFVIVMWVLEIIYSKYIYGIIDTSKQYKGKIDIKDIFLKTRPGLGSFFLVGFVLMFTIAITNTISIIVKWKSPIQWLFFAYSINLGVIYIFTLILDGINFLLKKRKK
ncbi:MAG: hypothetical protein M0R46_04630 [Candidatus Muirbacterium halophilum]|nr:hypothetical protein [Candidatus Muirbacterium halophilum]MCK9475181.1 hypothetical protein [Candidatus Muirbacterium halophilum]